MKLLKIFLAEIVSFYVLMVIGTLAVIFILNKFGVVDLVGHPVNVITFIALACLVFFVFGSNTIASNSSWVKNIPMSRVKLFVVGSSLNIVNLMLMLSSFLILISATLWDYLHMSDGRFFLFSNHFYGVFLRVTDVDVLPTISLLIIWGLVLFLLSTFVFASSFASLKLYPKELPLIRTIFKKYWPDYYREYVQLVELLSLVIAATLLYCAYKIFSLEAMLAAVVFCFVPFFVMTSIVYGHNFKKLYLLTTMRSFAFVVLIVFSLSVMRANHLVGGTDISINTKLREILFLGPSLYQLKEKELESYLALNIDDGMIFDLMNFLYKRTHFKGIPYYRRYESIYDFKEKQPIERFDEVILSKQKMSGLEAAIGLFNVSEITPQHLESFFNHARRIENRGYSDKKRQSSIDIILPVFYYMSWKDFSRSELEGMLSSKDEYIQELALRNAYVPVEVLASDFHRDLAKFRMGRPMTFVPKYDLSHVIVKNFDNFSSSIAALAGDLISEGQCRSISSVSVMKMAFKGEGEYSALNCKIYNHAAGFAQDRDFYLNGQYIWQVKQALISTDLEADEAILGKDL